MGVLRFSQTGHVIPFIYLSKRFLCFLLLFGLTWFSSASAQSSYYIDAEEVTEGQSLSLETLDTWQYKPDSDPDQHYMDIGSENWKNITLSLDADELPDYWQGNGWFRTTFEVDSSLFGQTLAIQGRIYGAMEIFLNGETIGVVGQVGRNQETEDPTGYFEPISFQFDSLSRQELYIRYSNNHYKKAWGKVISGLLLTIAEEDQVISFYQDLLAEQEIQKRFFYFQTGFVFVLVFLHAFLFLFNPKQRSNLIFCALMVTSFFLVLNNNQLIPDFSPDIFIQYLKWEGLLLSMFLAPLFVMLVHRLVYKKFTAWTWIIICSSVAIGIFSWFIPFQMRWLYICFYLFALLEIIRCLFTAIKSGEKLLWIIASGFLLGVIISIPRAVGMIIGSLDFLWADWVLGPLLGFNVVPLSFSVYLAYDFSQLHKKVKRQLKENKKLAEEKLAAEHEKQQLIQSQKQELEKKVQERTADLEESFKELKAAQEQLVQQEKLASLGQLTAGIAHEIKNPLNFVNNFSDLSVELVEEAKEELLAFSGQMSEGAKKSSPEGVKSGGAGKNGHGVVLEILGDIEANLRKIHEHGNRADSIVKSMLQHSRGGDGKREPSDLNALVKEYVNLSFHGMRANENPINVDIELELDEDVGEIPLIAEDFSRIIINLCNNAFDAMREKLDPGSKFQDAGEYEPKLTVRTKRDKSNVIIEVEDNGPGIPEEIKKEILQPFFTTKKGTYGTGLGLSITHDIVKAHGGEIIIESEPNKFTAFKIFLD